MPPQAFDTRHPDGAMPTTRWSLVEAVGADGTARREALERFAQDYWPAVYAFVRRDGHRPPEAEDLTQGFLISLIERDSLASVPRSGVRLRSWLLGALKNYLRNDWRDRNRLKRGGGAPHLSIDRDLGEAWLESSAMDGATPEAVFERRWAWGVVERALGELTALYEREGRGDLVGVLAPLVMGVGEQKSYSEVAEALGTSHANARVLAFRLRKRLRTLIREEVARTAGSTEEVDEELAHFFEILSGH